MIGVKLQVFDRVVTITPGIDKNTSAEDVFEHVINGARVIVPRQKTDSSFEAPPRGDDTQVRAS
jgi:hypothetical protein